MAMTRAEFRNALHRHGYSVADFAEEFGVATATVYEWGSRYGVPYWAVKVLRVMDMHGRYLFTGWPRGAAPDPPAPMPKQRRRTMSKS